MEPIGLARYDDQMDVVRHQAICQDFDGLPFCVGTQQREVGVPVRVAEEYRAAAIAPLGHVMRDPGDDNARNAGHGLQASDSCEHRLRAKPS